MKPWQIAGDRRPGTLSQTRERCPHLTLSQLLHDFGRRRWWKLLDLSRSIQVLVLVQGKKGTRWGGVTPHSANSVYPGKSLHILASVSSSPTWRRHYHLFCPTVMTRFSGEYLYESVLSHWTLWANERLFILLCLGPILLRPWKDSRLRRWHFLFNQRDLCFRQLNGLLVRKVSLRRRVYHLPRLTSNRGVTLETSPSAELHSWTLKGGTGLAGVVQRKEI